MLFNLRNRLFDENDGDGSDLGGGPEGLGDVEPTDEGSVEPQPWEEPLGTLSESITAMEGRVGEQLGPLQSQLKEVQESLGRQTAVEIPDDKIAAIEAMFVGYDPKFEGIGALLKDLLSSSVKQSPLDEAALRPHFESFGNDFRYEQATHWLNDVVSPQLSFDQEEVVNLENPQAPSTDLQKAWSQFWRTATAAQRQALTAQREDGAVAHPREFGQAMLAFDRKWRKIVQEKNESAGGASRRLAGATQTKSSGRSNSGGSQLRTREDGWRDYWKRKAS